MSKLASLILIVGGSLLFVGAAAAQGDPGYSSGGEPAYAASGGPSAARAGNGAGIKDTGPHRRPMTASLMLSTPWRYGIGIGFNGSFEIPIVHNGFIPSINNSFSLEPFLTIAWKSNNNGYNSVEDDFHTWEYTPGIAGLWSFYFTPTLRAYAALRLGATIINPSGNYKNDTDIMVELAPGVVWNMTPRIALRADVGWFSGLKGGIAILL